MTVEIEVKGYDNLRSRGSRNANPANATHIADNILVAPTSTWAAITGLEALDQGTECVIVSNYGESHVGVAFSDLANPARYHVVLSGTQRVIYAPPGTSSKPGRIKTL